MDVLINVFAAPHIIGVRLLVLIVIPALLHVRRDEEKAGGGAFTAVGGPAALTILIAGLRTRAGGTR